MNLEPGMCTALSKETFEKLQNASIKTVVDFITKDLELLSRRLHLPFKVTMFFNILVFNK